MPVRATKRGAERTPFAPGAASDVLICGASFAGLAVARELRGAGASVLVLDRYEIGERQTSACAAPTAWLRNLGLDAAIRQTFGSLLVHTPRLTARWELPWTFSTFDYPLLCRLLWEQCGDATFETATVTSPAGRAERRSRDSVSEGETDLPGDVTTVHTDRGDVSAPLVVDALGWRRVLGAGENVQPPDARLSRGLEVHPSGRGDDLELWLDPRYVSPGYGWSFPARDELRIGVGSFDPRVPVKDPTLALVADVDAAPDGWQGNWIPHALRPATEDGVFFAGDSAGHCLPLTAEGIRTALYFGIACGRELRAVVEGRQHVSQALRRYADLSASHAWQFRWLLRAQQSVRHAHGPVLDGLTRALARPGLSRWAFERYLEIAPPEAALPAPREAAGEPVAAAA